MSHYTMIIAREDEYTPDCLAKKRRGTVVKAQKEYRMELNTLSNEWYWDSFIESWIVSGKLV